MRAALAKHETTATASPDASIGTVGLQMTSEALAGPPVRSTGKGKRKDNAAKPSPEALQPKEKPKEHTAETTVEQTKKSKIREPKPVLRYACGHERHIAELQ